MLSRLSPSSQRVTQGPTAHSRNSSAWPLVPLPGRSWCTSRSARTRRSVVCRELLGGETFGGWESACPPPGRSSCRPASRGRRPGAGRTKLKEYTLNVHTAGPAGAAVQTAKHARSVGERPNPNGATKRFGKGRADTQSDTAARKEGGLRRRAINRGNMVHVLAPPGRPSSTDE